jgi:hypothetical protein
MAKFASYIAVTILVAGLFLVFSRLFAPQPIQIMLQTGQEVTSPNAEFFSLAETLLLIIASFLMGAAATYLFYNSDGAAAPKQLPHKPELAGNRHEIILPLLKYTFH